MSAQRRNSKVIIVGGGGTIGSSTALHLVRSGYEPANITVLDKYAIPSAQSAANDLNKIMSIRVGSKMATDLSLEALKMWKKDELFKSFFHKVGMVSDRASCRRERSSLTSRVVRLFFIAACNCRTPEGVSRTA
jgi:sarcosine oxidase / L-pipecolate oxidase